MTKLTGNVHAEMFPKLRLFYGTSFIKIEIVNLKVLNVKSTLQIYIFGCVVQLRSFLVAVFKGKRTGLSWNFFCSPSYHVKYLKYWLSKFKNIKKVKSSNPR